MQKRGEQKTMDRKSSLRLAVVAWPFIAIIVVQALLASFSLQMVTSLRSYVSGESMWSKGQHDAIYFLSRYIDTTQSSYLERHRQALSVPLGDHEARLALEASPPDHAAAAAGFLRGGNHPDDIAGLIWLFENFSWFSYMSAAIDDWRNAETTLFQLEDLADEMARAALVQPWQRREWAERLDAINDQVTPLTHAFSNSLGQGTRFVQTSLLIANLAIAALFVALTLWRLNSFLRHRRSIEHELSWRASHDALTKLPNRAAFERAVEHALTDGSATALLFVDLDQFKVVNDSGGHAAGDELLCMLAERLPSILGPGVMLARLGGDEFGVLLHTGSVDEALITAHQLRTTLGELPFVWNDQHFTVSASVGFVRLDRSVGSLATALRAADIACYMAKEKGRNRVHVYSPDDAEQAQMAGNIGWVRRLQRALNEDSFVLYAQDIVPLARNAVGEHCEILVRLADRGDLIGPGRFIPAAERFGLMPQLDRWVVRHALTIIATRIGLEPKPHQRTYAINLSAPAIGDDSFLPFLKEQFETTGVPPQLICFEITETSAVANLERAAAFIAALRGIGCKFALDDFGAGMSSFHYLKRLPVDFLKIDGGYVKKGMLRDSTDRAVVETINHLGHVTGIKTVAEFVETADILAALEAIGVDYAQGYYMGIPRPFVAEAAAMPERLSA
jgi:diguanylate cyclase (GGDEF)-like protein